VQNFFHKTITLLFILISFELGAVEKFSINELSTEEQNKKLDTLTWYNYDNPKNHTILLEKANAEIYILESEYYLKGKKDINQYSWWIFNVKSDDGGDELMIFGDGYTIYVRYISDGHVKIDDWKSVDQNQLITEMREIQEGWVEEYKRKNIDYVEDINWIYKPTIDNKKNSVNYSYEVYWNGKKGKHKAIQTESLVLGREGYIELSFVKTITPTDTKIDLENFSNFAKEFTDGVDYIDGSKHSDFKSGDKIAAVGIGGLVAGTLGVKALAKVGILAKFLPFLMKFWWIIIAPIAAIIGMSNKKKTSSKKKRKEIDYD